MNKYLPIVGLVVNLMCYGMEEKKAARQQREYEDYFSKEAGRQLHDKLFRDAMTCRGTYNNVIKMVGIDPDHGFLDDMGSWSGSGLIPSNEQNEQLVYVSSMQGHRWVAVKSAGEQKSSDILADHFTIPTPTLESSKEHKHQGKFVDTPPVFIETTFK